MLLTFHAARSHRSVCVKYLYSVGMLHPSHAHTPVTIRDAATAAVLRDCPRSGLEVLLLRRHHGHVFAAGADVFPGGAVDVADTDHLDEGRICGCGLTDAAWRMAALRECFEEAGLLFGSGAAELDHNRVAAERRALNEGRRSWQTVVESLGVTPDLAGLIAFARWTTPPDQPKRYATRFYAIAAPAGQAACADGHEMVAAEWVAPADALAEADSGQRWLMLPTRSSLEQLACYDDTAGALADLAAGDADERT